MPGDTGKGKGMCFHSALISGPGSEWMNTTHIFVKKPGGQRFWTLFGPGMEGGVPRFEIRRWGKKTRGFAPSGGTGIPKMLTVEVQKQQYSTGFIRFSTWRNAL